VGRHFIQFNRTQDSTNFANVFEKPWAFEFTKCKRPFDQSNPDSPYPREIDRRLRGITGMFEDDFSSSITSNFTGEFFDFFRQRRA